jgi:Zn-dependent protease/predicted transcriptional regulator
MFGTSKVVFQDKRKLKAGLSCLSARPTSSKMACCNCEMEPNIKLGKLFGIEIGVNYSWFIIFFLITFSLWSQYASEHPRWPATWHVTLAVATSVLFFLSLLLHELSHSLLALARGLPVHSITLFVFGGVSRIEREAMSAGTEFLVGVIGPVSSLIIAGLFYGLALLVPPQSPLGVMASWLSWINLVLAIFNLIPGYPLDGGRVLRSIIWAVTGSVQKATQIAARAGQGFAYLLIIGGIIIAFAGHLLIGRNDVAGGLWLAFIGWFLLDAARSSEQALVFERAMRGALARDVMSADVPTVPASTLLADFFDNYLMRTGRRCFLVTQDGRLLGLITTHEIKAVPRDHWPLVTVEQAMKPLEAMRWVDPSTNLQHVLEIMERDDVNQVPVVSSGNLQGLIRREDLLRFISTRAEFGY